MVEPYSNLLPEVLPSKHSITLPPKEIMPTNTKNLEQRLVATVLHGNPSSLEVTEALLSHWPWSSKWTYARLTRKSFLIELHKLDYSDYVCFNPMLDFNSFIKFSQWNLAHGVVCLLRTTPLWIHMLGILVPCRSNETITQLSVGSTLSSVSLRQLQTTQI